MTSLTAGEIEELRSIASCTKSLDPKQIWAMHAALPALLAMLQPPVAADVAEAMEWVQEQLDQNWWEELAAEKTSTILRAYRTALAATEAK